MALKINLWRRNNNMTMRKRDAMVYQFFNIIGLINKNDTPVQIFCKFFCLIPMMPLVLLYFFYKKILREILIWICKKIKLICWYVSYSLQKICGCFFDCLDCKRLIKYFDSSLGKVQKSFKVFLLLLRTMLSSSL